MLPTTTTLLFPLILTTLLPSTTPTSPPVPTQWPPTFHALLYMNTTSTGHLQITNLYYDWPRGLNLNLIQKQLGSLLYDVEWNNGTSFYYTLGRDGTCKTMLFPVGIPRQDWLLGSTYLGRRTTDGFLCDVWEKVDFIWYYEDVVSRRPVRWDFFDGITTHVMTFEVGAVLEDSQWQAPAYCFTDGGGDGDLPEKVGKSTPEGIGDDLRMNLRKLAYSSGSM